MAEAISSVKLLQRYFRDDPATAANNIESLSVAEASELVSQLSTKVAARVFSRLSPSFAANVLNEIPQEKAKEIITIGGADLAATLLLTLPDSKKQSFVDTLPEELRASAQEILTFPADSAGNLMRTDYAAFSRKLSVDEVITKLRSDTVRQRPKSNIYIVDDDQKLVGVIGMRDILLAEPSTKIETLMTKDVIAVEPFASTEDVARVVANYKFLSIPVKDAQGRLIGVVRASSLLADAESHATQDIQKLFGVSAQERAFSPISFCLKKRLPWLHINLVTAFMAASVIALFEDIIAQITVLAVFLPVVAGQGGNAGAQSLAVVMRGILLREIPPQDIRRLLIKESTIGIVNGVLVGLVTAAVAWLWYGNPYLGLVIGLAMIVNLAAAGLAGAAIPIGMKRYGLDPAQSSNIILTTVTDIVGFFAFLGIAMIFKGFLV